MIKKFARFANDAYCILRAQLPAGRKSELWLNRIHPSGKMLGFDIAYFDRPTLVGLYREIFVRQYYYFRANIESPRIFDCGANFGMATLYFKWLYPKARIEAFEPDPATFAVLKEMSSKTALPMSPPTTVPSGVRTGNRILHRSYNARVTIDECRPFSTEW